MAVAGALGLQAQVVSIERAERKCEELPTKHTYISRKSHNYPFEAMKIWAQAIYNATINGQLMTGINSGAVTACRCLPQSAPRAPHKQTTTTRNNINTGPLTAPTNKKLNIRPTHIHHSVPIRILPISLRSSSYSALRCSHFLTISSDLGSLLWISAPWLHPPFGAGRSVPFRATSCLFAPFRALSPSAHSHFRTAVPGSPCLARLCSCLLALFSRATTVFSPARAIICEGLSHFTIFSVQSLHRSLFSFSFFCSRLASSAPFILVLLFFHLGALSLRTFLFCPAP